MISVIVCSVDPAKTKSIQEHYEHLLRNVPHEVLLIQNPPSIAAGYNEGIGRSVGDVLIFSHDDIEFLQEDFVGTLQKHLQSVDVLGVAGSRSLTNPANPNWISGGQLYGQVAHPHGSGFSVCRYGTEAALAPDCMLLDGCWICAKRTVVEVIRFDDATFTGFHLYDLDFSMRAHRYRYRVGVASDLFPIHYSGGSYNDSWQMECRKFEAKYQLFIESYRSPGSFGGSGGGPWPPFTSCHAHDKAEVIRLMQENLSYKPGDYDEE